MKLKDLIPGDVFQFARGGSPNIYRVKRSVTLSHLAPRFACEHIANYSHGEPVAVVQGDGREIWFDGGRPVKRLTGAKLELVGTVLCGVRS